MRLPYLLAALGGSWCRWLLVAAQGLDNNACQLTTSRHPLETQGDWSVDRNIFGATLSSLDDVDILLSASIDGCLGGYRVSGTSGDVTDLYGVVVSDPVCTGNNEGFWMESPAAVDITTGAVTILGGRLLPCKCYAYRADPVSGHLLLTHEEVASCDAQDCPAFWDDYIDENSYVLSPQAGSIGTMGATCVAKEVCQLYDGAYPSEMKGKWSSSADLSSASANIDQCGASYTSQNFKTAAIISDVQCIGSLSGVFLEIGLDPALDMAPDPSTCACTFYSVSDTGHKMTRGSFMPKTCRIEACPQSASFYQTTDLRLPTGSAGLPADVSCPNSGSSTPSPTTVVVGTTPSPTAVASPVPSSPGTVKPSQPSSGGAGGLVTPAPMRAPSFSPSGSGGAGSAATSSPTPSPTIGAATPAPSVSAGGSVTPAPMRAPSFSPGSSGSGSGGSATPAPTLSGTSNPAPSTGTGGALTPAPMRAPSFAPGGSGSGGVSTPTPAPTLGGVPGPTPSGSGGDVITPAPMRAPSFATGGGSGGSSPSTTQAPSAAPSNSGTDSTPAPTSSDGSQLMPSGSGGNLVTPAPMRAPSFSPSGSGGSATAAPAAAGDGGVAPSGGTGSAVTPAPMRAPSFAPGATGSSPTPAPMPNSKPSTSGSAVTPAPMRAPSFAPSGAGDSSTPVPTAAGSQIPTPSGGSDVVTPAPMRAPSFAPSGAGSSITPAPSSDAGAGLTPSAGGGSSITPAPMRPPSFAPSGSVDSTVAPSPSGGSGSGGSLVTPAPQRPPSYSPGSSSTAPPTQAPDDGAVPACQVTGFAHPNEAIGEWLVDRNFVDSSKGNSTLFRFASIDTCLGSYSFSDLSGQALPKEYGVVQTASKCTGYGQGIWMESSATLSEVTPGSVVPAGAGSPCRCFAYHVDASSNTMLLATESVTSCNFADCPSFWADYTSGDAFHLSLQASKVDEASFSCSGSEMECPFFDASYPKELQGSYVSTLSDGETTATVQPCSAMYMGEPIQTPLGPRSAGAVVSSTVCLQSGSGIYLEIALRSDLGLKPEPNSCACVYYSVDSSLNTVTMGYALPQQACVISGCPTDPTLYTSTVYAGKVTTAKEDFTCANAAVGASGSAPTSSDGGTSKAGAIAAGIFGVFAGLALLIFGSVAYRKRHEIKENWDKQQQIDAYNNGDADEMAVNGWGGESQGYTAPSHGIEAAAVGQEDTAPKRRGSVSTRMVSSSISNAWDEDDMEVHIDQTAPALQSVGSSSFGSRRQRLIRDQTEDGLRQQMLI